MPPHKIIIKSRSSLRQSHQEQNQTYSNGHESLKNLSKLTSNENLVHDQSQQYFDHLSGRCLCTLCNCGKHHCNGKNCLQKLKCSGGKTIYQCEFVRKTPESDTLYNKNLFPNPKVEGAIQGVTTYKHDYPGYLSHVTLQKGPNQLTTNQGSFSGYSTYGNMYRNWGVGDSAMLLPQNSPTVIQNLPFSGRSSYRDSFQQFHVEPVKSTKGLNQQRYRKQQQRSPMDPPNVSFVLSSVAKSSFLPIKSERFATQPRKQGLTPLNPSFRGQYNTVYHNEFESKHPQPCPAKEVLEAYEA